MESGESGESVGDDWLLIKQQDAATIKNVKHLLEERGWFDKKRSIHKRFMEEEEDLFLLPIVTMDDMKPLKLVFPHHEIRRLCDLLLKTSKTSIFEKQLVAYLKQKQQPPRTLATSSHVIYGDMIVLPEQRWLLETTSSIREGILDLICSVWGVRRVAMQSRILPDGYRTPQVTLLRAVDGWVTLKENGILYAWDVTRCMHSQGNINEKIRMSKLNIAHEVVVDLCAGIGYFTLPLLVYGNAAHVYACEWNPAAIEALKTNLVLNRIPQDRYSIIEGDHQTTSCLEGIADRVVVGLLPSSDHVWSLAVRCLKNETGGILHLHGNVKKGDEENWKTYVIQTLEGLCEQLKGRKTIRFPWVIEIIQMKCIKSYAPKIHHYVMDVRCQPATTTAAAVAVGGGDDET
jgi:tRNA G37 N-methylase Trm5